MAEIHTPGQVDGHQNGSSIRDPTGDSPPDCNEALNAQLVRDIAIARSISVVDATVWFLSSWHAAHDRAVAQWETHLEQKAIADAAASLAAQKEVVELAKETEAALLVEASKKKAKNPELDTSATLGSDLLPYPSALTIEKTHDFKWTPFWNYGHQACLEARNIVRAEHGRTIDLVAGPDGGLSVATASRESPRAVPDELLTWDQILEAKTVFLHVAAQVGWSEEIRLAFAQCILNLDNHWMRRVKPYGTTILVRYFARARLEFFSRLSLGEKAFDISFINEELLKFLREEYVRDEESRVLAAVRSFPFPHLCHDTNDVFRTMLNTIPISSSHPLFPPSCVRTLTRTLFTHAPTPFLPHTAMHAHPHSLTLRRTPSLTPRCTLSPSPRRTRSPSSRCTPHVTHLQLQAQLAANSSAPAPAHAPVNLSLLPPGPPTAPLVTTSHGGPPGGGPPGGGARGGVTRRAPSNRAARTQGSHPFPSGAGERAPSACTVCLGRHWHDVRNCSATRIANSSVDTLVQRFQNSLVLRATGQPICSAFNLRHGCRDPTHTNHQCSGCGSTAHNAQSCHLGTTA